MIKKLKQKKGETMIETLVSLMIAVLCIGLVYNAVVAAANINKQTKALDQKYSEELNAVEGMADDILTVEKEVVITFTPTDGNAYYEEELTVTVYGEDDSAFISYDYEGDER